MTVTLPFPALLLIACLACLVTWLFAYLAFHPRETLDARPADTGTPPPVLPRAGYFPDTGPLLILSEQAAARAALPRYVDSYATAREQEIRELTATGIVIYGELS